MAALSSLLEGVFEQGASDPSTHGVRSDPEMVEVQSVAFVGQKIKADSASIFPGAIGHICGDEFRAHRQDIPPILDPSFRMAPMPLGGMSDFRQGICLLGFGADNLHFICSRRPACPAEAGEGGWATRGQTTPHTSPTLLSRFAQLRKLSRVKDEAATGLVIRG